MNRRITSIHDDRARADFAERAGKWFSENPHGWSFTDDGETNPGDLIGLRWGYSNDCVLVLRIGDDEPVVYGQAIHSGSIQRGNEDLVL